MSLPRWLSNKMRMVRSIVGEPEMVTVGEFVPPDEPSAEDRYILGVSLGQPDQRTSMVAIRRRTVPSEMQTGATYRTYTVLGLHRWSKGTAYSIIAADISAKTAEPPFRDCLLALDRSGVGIQIVNMIRAAQPAASVKPIMVTGEVDVQVDGPGWRVPRLDLVAVVNEILQSQRLEILKKLKDATMLKKELLAFRAKPGRSGGEWRIRPEDDAILALACGMWVGEKTAGGGFYFSG